MGFGVKPWIMFFVALNCAVLLHSYNRPPPRKIVQVNLPHNGDDDGGVSPEQVHISLAGEEKMRITWMTKSLSTEAIVKYGLSQGTYSNTTNGNTSRYRYALYNSGAIHEVVIGPLNPNTVYYYHCGSVPSSEFSFKTPPSSFPIKFAVAGDLGQTGWTKSTLQHISESEYDILILPGDLSYADLYQPLWDSFGRLVEPVASKRPWMVTQGNHEVEKIPIIHRQPFTAYNARWPMPHDESGSTSNLYYSFDSAGVHVIMLGSYTDFAPGSEQYRWLEADLGKVDRSKTPWIVVVIHAPWYNSNTAHQGEAESLDMKRAMEGLVYGARVDVVFAGHVHAYERFTRVFNDRPEKCGPIHITIGDGGNREGLASKYKDPQPEISLFREASFGHGQLQVVNASHARWTWHRNDDDVAVASDSVWITSHSSSPDCQRS